MRSPHTVTKSSPRSPQLEKACAQQRRPNAAKNKINLLKIYIKFIYLGTSLVVHWLRLHAPNAGGPGSIPGQGTRSHMPQRRSRTRQQRSHVPQLRPGAAK